MNQSALQRQQAELTQNNQKELETVKAKLALSTQNDLEKAKAVLSEKTQTRLEEAKNELEQRARVAGLVGDNRFKAAEVLVTGFGNVVAQLYAYQHLAKENPTWSAVNRQAEQRRIGALLQEAGVPSHRTLLLRLLDLSQRIHGSVPNRFEIRF
jgi:hypothetical protein